MPLIAEPIKIELQKIFDQKFPGFEGFPSDNIQTANRWSKVADTAGKMLLPPSLTTEQAKKAFALTALPINYDNGLIVLSAAFTAYAVTLIPGMLPAFVATPPIVPIDFSVITPVGLAGADSNTIATLISEIIVIWFKTGTAVASGTTSVINWT